MALETNVLLLGFVAYLALVQLLRFRAVRKVQRKYARFIANPYLLDYKTAHEILSLPLLYEFPFLFAFGTQWALIKSYGIATGTPLLVRTGQLTRADKVGKRAEDTGVFITEFLIGDIDSERGRRSLSKMNWLHRRYQINDGDYVHTLALFVLEPHRWIDQYEWRPLTELEKVAHFVYWKEIGNRMGFEGIPDTLEDLRAWKQEYEKTHLVYSKHNKMCADATLDLFLRDVPVFLRASVRTLMIACLEEEQVRKALGYEEPPLWATSMAYYFFRMRGWLIRFLFLPRLRPLDPLAKEGPDGRLYRDADYMAFEPWYIKATWSNWWKVWFQSKGRIVPGDKFKSDGYLPEELGPLGLEKVSREPVLKQAEAMKEYADQGGAAVVGCPFRYGF